MTTLDIHTTVGQLVAASPRRSRVFEKLGIDYCCGGKKPLVEVCEKKNLDPQTVLTMLEAIEEIGSSPDLVNADAMTLTDLCAHIVQTHHEYLRQELPRLDHMTHKVAAVHGDGEPRLREIREIFVGLQEEMMSHMMKEENILFPMIGQLEASNGAPAFHCGSIANPIAQMEREHDDAGSALAKLHELTDNYTPPDWACNTFRAMYDALKTLELDMHQHVHKENSILFPKAIELEQKKSRV
ncbi:MAG: iron-sulfur cluster repair di-iron protein [Phycisphaerales bacterium]